MKVKIKVKKINCRKYPVYLVCLSVLLLTTGCAHFFAGAKGEDALKDLAAKEWQAKIDNDWGVVYELASDKFKKSVKRDQFIRGCGLDVEGFAIDNVKIAPDGKSAVVTVFFDVRQMGILLKGARLKEDWIIEKGKWRIDMKPGPRSPFDF